MPRYDYRCVDVFTTERFGGNPLAVFPDARGLDASTMQRIANELNLSETTFVTPTERADCDFRLRIFTPRSELPMAGHPTIGTAWVLSRGNRVVFEEGVGPVPVTRRPLGTGESGWWMSPPSPTFVLPSEDRSTIASALGLTLEDLANGLPVEIGSSGVPGLCVALANLEALGRASLGSDRWGALASSRVAQFAYVFVAVEPRRVRARMFAPALGVSEDPATGGAAGPLGAYLMRHDLVARDAGGCTRIRCEQGVEMGRPSAIEIEVFGAADSPDVHVGGACVDVGGGWVDV